MGSNFTKKVTRFHLSLDGKSEVRRFINIQTLYKKGHFFEYKISLEGFPKTGVTFLRRATVDSVKGIRRTREKESMPGEVQISYHRDGVAMYKDVASNRNIKPVYPHRPMESVNEPELFLRLLHFNLRSLRQHYEPKDAIVIPLKKFTTNTNISCLIFVSRGRKWNIKTRNDRTFKDTQVFSFDDTQEDVGLDLVFFRSEVLHPVVAIDNPRPLVKLYNRGLYFYYKIKDYVHLRS